MGNCSSIHFFSHSSSFPLLHLDVLCLSISDWLTRGGTGEVGVWKLIQFATTMLAFESVRYATNFQLKSFLHFATRSCALLCHRFARTTARNRSSCKSKLPPSPIQCNRCEIKRKGGRGQLNKRRTRTEKLLLWKPEIVLRLDSGILCKTLIRSETVTDWDLECNGQQTNVEVHCLVKVIWNAGVGVDSFKFVNV